jgi:cytochrome P450
MSLPPPYTLTLKMLAILLASIFVAYGLFRSLYTRYRYYRLATAHSCRSPKRWYSGPHGLVEFYRFMKWARQGKHVEYAVSRWDTLGVKTYIMRLFGEEIVFTIEPRNIQAVLATKFKDFSLGDLRKEAFHTLLGDGIFTLDGKGWEHSRALLRPQFSREQVADVELLDVHVTRLLKLMLGKGSEPVDLQPWIFDLTLDSATEFLFGESANSLLMGQEQAGFADAFNRSLGWIMWKLRFPAFARIYSPREMKEVNAAVHGFVDRYVDNALNREKHPLPKEMGHKYIFLDAVVADMKDRQMLWWRI